MNPLSKLYPQSARIILTVCLTLCILMSSQLMKAQSVTVTATVGATGVSYSTLKNAFDAINSGTHQGEVTIAINESTSESASAVLNASGTGSAGYTSIKIYPTATGLSIRGDINGPLIDLYGADNVTINGSLSETSPGCDLSIINSSVGESLVSTIRFINDATSNVVKYCTLKGSGAYNPGNEETNSNLNRRPAVVLFSDGLISGNNSNLIDHNRITNANGNRPSICVRSIGTYGKSNSENTISNNNFYDFLTAGSYTMGINISSNSTAFIITGNSLYETQVTWNTPYFDGGNTMFTGIGIASGTHTVTNNFIGGKSSDHSGIMAISCSSFAGISLSTSSSLASTVQNNTVKNIYCKINNRGQWMGIVIGVFSGASAASVNADVSGNTIGSATGTGSITIDNTTGTTFSAGIFVTTLGSVTIQNNQVGSIQFLGPSLIPYAGIYLNVESPSEAIVSNNVIGSLTTPGSIGIGLSPGPTDISILAYKAQFYGIYEFDGVATITGNTVANCYNNYYPSASDPDQTLVPTIGGIRVVGGTNTLSNNLFRDLTSSSADVTGIYTEGGNSTFNNNIVSLGGNSPAMLSGISDNGGTNKFYFNTVYVGGTLTEGSNPSFALISQSDVSANDYRDNIFMNTRSNSDVAGGDHYAIVLTVNTPGTIDYNDYYKSGGGILGYIGSPITTLDDLKTATSQDGHSLIADPQFTNPGSASFIGYYPTVFLNGESSTDYTTDFAGTTRATTPTVGALEKYTGITWTGASTTDWNTAGNWNPGNKVPGAADDVLIPSATNQPHITVTGSSLASINNLIIRNGAALTIDAGKALTVNGTLDNGGTFNIKSDATGTGSLITKGTVAGAGFNIERYITSAKWHLISMPNEVTTANTFVGDYLQSWNEPNAAWSEIIAMATELYTPLTGYSLWTMKGSSTYTLTGTPNTGNLSTSLSSIGKGGIYTGANLLGNPYPSSIDWSLLDDTYGAVYYWVGNDTNGDGSYAAWNNSEGPGSQYISPMQGFFIVSANRTFSLTNASRVHGNSTYYKSADGSKDNLLVLETVSKGISDKLYVNLNADATEDFDLQHDAYKFASGTPGLSELYSYSGDKKLSIDVRPACEVMQLGFSNSLSGEYQISISQINGIADAILEDTKTGTFTDLQNGACTFSYTAGEPDQRFKLHFGTLGISDRLTKSATIYSYRKTTYINLMNGVEGDIYIYNVAGQLVATKLSAKGMNEIGLKNTGNYIVRVVTDKSSQVKKIFIR